VDCYVHAAVSYRDDAGKVGSWTSKMEVGSRKLEVRSSKSRMCAASPSIVRIHFPEVAEERIMLSYNSVHWLRNARTCAPGFKSRSSNPGARTPRLNPRLKPRGYNPGAQPWGLELAWKNDDNIQNKIRARGYHCKSTCITS
jgi:hypothetical protein